MQDLRGFPSHNPPLSACEKESSIFPHRTPGTSAASREATTWGSDVELEEMESEQTGLAFSLPHSPDRVCANSPVEFAHDFLFPSPRARNTISFGLDDIQHTAVSDSEDFGPALADALLPSGQEARPSAAYSELVDVLSRATEKLALDWPDSKHDERVVISETCMDFAPGLLKVTLRPRPGYIPKVLSTSFRSQVVTLHSFHTPPFASSEDERLHMLCSVRALKLYVDRSKVWRKSSQLLVCFGAGRRGLATSKQRISHWVRDAISLAYEARNLPSPLVFGRILLGA